MLQNATHLRKSEPWRPNISDERVSRIAPATQNASLQILFKPPMPANVFEAATKPQRFAHFWQGTQSLAPATQKDIWTSKSAPRPSVFYTFDFEMCFAPQQHGLFRHLNLQKRSEGGVFLAFSLANVLRATTACNISISHLARWLRTRRFSEPTFRPATNHWKNTVNRKFSTFSRTPASSFFWLFLYSDLLSSSLLFSDSYHLCFSICPYCRKFDFF